MLAQQIAQATNPGDALMVVMLIVTGLAFGLIIGLAYGAKRR